MSPQERATDEPRTAATFLQRVHLLRSAQRQKATCVLEGDGIAFAFVQGVPAAMQEKATGEVSDEPESLYWALVKVLAGGGLSIVYEPPPDWFPRASDPSMASLDAIVVEASRRWPVPAAEFAGERLDQTISLANDAAAIAERCELVAERERTLVQRMAAGGTLGEVLDGTELARQVAESLVMALTALGRLRFSTGVPVSGARPQAGQPGRHPSQINPRATGPRPRASQPGPPSQPRPSQPAPASQPRPTQPVIRQVTKDPRARPGAPPPRPEVVRTRKVIRRSSHRAIASTSPGDSSLPPRDSTLPQGSARTSDPGRRSRPMPRRPVPPMPNRNQPIDPLAPSTPFTDDRAGPAVSPATELLDEARDLLAEGKDHDALQLVVKAGAADESHPEVSLYQAWTAAFMEHKSARATAMAQADNLEGLAREALALDHNAAFAHFVRGCIANAQGRQDDARRAFAFFLRLRPGDRWGERMMRSLSGRESSPGRKKRR